MKKVTGEGSSTQGASSTPSARADEAKEHRGAAASSQNASQKSDIKKHSQPESSQSGTSSRDSQKTGSNADSKTTTEDKTQAATGAAQQSGSGAEKGAAAPQNGSAGAASSGTASNAASANTGSNAVANLDTRQRSEVTQAFSSTNVNTVSNVNFKVSVGTTITDEIHLAPLPAEVVRLVPQYRGYRYVVVRDEIVIVEPKTKKIVEVIHRSGGSRKSASVSLSSEQRKKFKSSVETTGSTRTTSTRIEIHQGEVLPDDVSLMDVPETVITEVPELRTYRYVVVGDEVAIVEPDTRRVIEIIQ